MKILRECLRHAQRTSHPEKRFKHYSYIVRDNQIISWSRNKSGQNVNPLIYPEYSKIHAEYAAWAKTNRIKNFYCVNIRLDNNNATKIAKPCPCCHAFLSKAGCLGFFYTTKDGFYAC